MDFGFDVVESILDTVDAHSDQMPDVMEDFDPIVLATVSQIKHPRHAIFVIVESMRSEKKHKSTSYPNFIHVMRWLHLRKTGIDTKIDSDDPRIPWRKGIIKTYRDYVSFLQEHGITGDPASEEDEDAPDVEDEDEHAQNAQDEDEDAHNVEDASSAEDLAAIVAVEPRHVAKHPPRDVAASAVSAAAAAAAPAGGDHDKDDECRPKKRPAAAASSSTPAKKPKTQRSMRERVANKALKHMASETFPSKITFDLEIIKETKDESSMTSWLCNAMSTGSQDSDVAFERLLVFKKAEKLNEN